MTGTPRLQRDLIAGRFWYTGPLLAQLAAMLHVAKGGEVLLTNETFVQVGPHVNPNPDPSGPASAKPAQSLGPKRGAGGAHHADAPQDPQLVVTSQPAMLLQGVTFLQRQGYVMVDGKAPPPPLLYP